MRQSRSAPNFWNATVLHAMSPFTSWCSFHEHHELLRSSFHSDRRAGVGVGIKEADVVS
jgi:hypothetical protein